MCLTTPRRPLNLVRGSPDVLAAHATARIVLHARAWDEDEWFDVYDEDWGSIDFSTLRFVVGSELVGEGGLVFFRGVPGEGWAVRGEPDNPLDATSPFWLIELIRGAVTAEELDADAEGGEGTVAYSCVFDLIAASDSSEHRISVFGGRSVDDLRAIPGEVRLDADGCLRGASCRLPGYEIDLKLDDLGGAGPIELPTEAKRVW